MNAELFSLAGRVALVTGASSGLGSHFAKTLAAAGATVILAARRVDAIELLARRIIEAGGQAQAVPMDVSDRRSVAAALDRVDTPHVLVNNAGIASMGPALDMADDDWDSVLDTNLKGAWITAQETARRMVGAGVAGSIINVTSILATRVSGGIAPYCASKAALAQLTRALALEWARHGIRVNSLAPGYVVTALNEEFLASSAGEKMRMRVPQRRFGRLEDLDGPLLLLASDAGAHMTGSELVVDGGHLCSSL